MNYLDASRLAIMCAASRIFQAPPEAVFWYCRTYYKDNSLVRNPFREHLDAILVDFPSLRSAVGYFHTTQMDNALANLIEISPEFKSARLEGDFYGSPVIVKFQHPGRSCLIEISHPDLIDSYSRPIWFYFGDDPQIARHNVTQWTREWRTAR